MPKRRVRYEQTRRCVVCGSEIEWNPPAIVSSVAAPRAMGFRQAAVLSSVSFFLGEPSPASHSRAVQC